MHPHDKPTTKWVTGDTNVELPSGYGRTPISAEELAVYNAAADVGMRKLLELSKPDAPGFSHVRFAKIAALPLLHAPVPLSTCGFRIYRLLEAQLQMLLQ